MRVSKGSTITIYSDFTDQESQRAVIIGMPTYSVWYYKDGIFKVVDNQFMVLVDDGVYCADFTLNEDAVYCFEIKSMYSDDTNVVEHQVVVCGNPTEIPVFVSFTDQNGESISLSEISNAQFRSIQNKTVVNNWTNLSNIEGSLYIGNTSVNLDDGEVFVEFRATYDGLNIIGGYELGGDLSGGDGGGGIKIMVKPQQPKFIMSVSQPKITIKTREATTSIVSKRSSVVVNPNQGAKIKI